MTKIDIISGFLGAGKTTLIKKLLSEAFKGEQVVLIENEFGEIGIDGGFLKESGIEIREMNSGCICCSLVGDFGKSLREVVDTYHPDRILIEPSGVGKLSDVIKAVRDVQGDIDAQLNSFSTVVDVTKCRIYRKNFGEFFSNQIEYAKPRLSRLRSRSFRGRRSWRQWNPASPWKKSCSRRLSARSADITTSTASAAGMTMSMDTTTIMSMMSTIMMNMTMLTANAAAMITVTITGTDIIITAMKGIIMRTRSSPAGAERRSTHTQRSRSPISSGRSRRMVLTEMCCVPKAWSPERTESGSTLIWFPKNMRCAPERRNIPGVSA